MNIQYVLKNMLIVFLLGLFGCGGDDSSESDGFISQSLALLPATLTAQDASFSGELSTLYEIPLAEHVKVSDGSGFELTEVVPLSESPDCQVESMTDSSFSISAMTPRVCNFRYRVVSAGVVHSDSQGDNTTKVSSQSSQSQSSSATAVARVAVSADPNSTVLMPISAVTLENQIITVR